MNIFSKTTLQKGLESLLPDLTPEEEGKILGTLTKTIKKYDFNNTVNITSFYNLFSQNLNNEYNEYTEQEILFGLKIFSDLKKRMKSYYIPLNPNEGYLMQKRKREIDMIKRILTEEENKNENWKC